MQMIRAGARMGNARRRRVDRRGCQARRLSLESLEHRHLLATLTVGGDHTSPAAFAGVLSGPGGSVTKIGTGALTLSGHSTYSGATTVNTNGGTLQLGGSAQLSNSDDTFAGPQLSTTRIASKRI